MGEMVRTPICNASLPFNDTSIISTLKNFLIDESPSFIKNENRLIRKKCFSDVSLEINYLAFKISKCQYFSFLDLLKAFRDKLTFLI